MHELGSYDIIKRTSESPAPYFSGKSIAHAQERHASLPVHLPASPLNIIPIAMQEPSHHFHYLNSEPVTLSPRYFIVPSYWSLKSINKTEYIQLKNRHVNRPDKGTLEE